MIRFFWRTSPSGIDVPACQRGQAPTREPRERRLRGTRGRPRISRVLARVAARAAHSSTVCHRLSICAVRDSGCAGWLRTCSPGRPTIDARAHVSPAQAHSHTGGCSALASSAQAGPPTSPSRHRALYLPAWLQRAPGTQVARHTRPLRWPPGAGKGRAQQHRLLPSLDLRGACTCAGWLVVHLRTCSPGATGRPTVGATPRGTCSSSDTRRPLCLFCPSASTPSMKVSGALASCLHTQADHACPRPCL